MYTRLQNISGQMLEIRQQKDVKGHSVGWDFDILPYTIKQGCTTYIGAAPASGKTELWFEFLINTSCLHNWNHVVFSPETGSAAEIYAELCHKYIGKPYHLMSQGEQVTAEMFVNQHFVVIDPIEEDLTIEKFYDLVDEIERKEDITIHTTTIDPWNELTEEFNGTLIMPEKYQPVTKRNIIWDGETALNFYITEYNDPNIMYFKFKVLLKDLVDSKIVVNCHNVPDKFSVYTRRVLKNYVLEIK